MIVSDELRSFEKLLHVIFIESTISQLAVGVELLAIRFYSWSWLEKTLKWYTQKHIHVLYSASCITYSVAHRSSPGRFLGRDREESILTRVQWRRSKIFDRLSRIVILAETSSPTRNWNPNTLTERHTWCKKTTRCQSSEILSYTMFRTIRSRFCVCPF